MTGLPDVTLLQELHPKILLSLSRPQYAAGILGVPALLCLFGQLQCRAIRLPASDLLEDTLPLSAPSPLRQQAPIQMCRLPFMQDLIRVRFGRF